MPLTFTEQYFRPGFNLRTRKAAGTTIFFFLSYGGGTPSNSFNRASAASPLGVLCGNMPRMVRWRIREGDRWWKGPHFLGLTMCRLCMKSA